LQNPQDTTPDDRRASWPLAVFVVSALGLVSDCALAQAASEGKGTVTILIGEASAPVGGIPEQVANPGSPAPKLNQHGKAFRLASSYHFAQFLSAEFGLSYFGPFNSSTAYGVGDTLQAQSQVIVIETDLVGHIPVAPRARFNLSAGIAETALHTTLSTVFGTPLPPGIPTDENIRRTGVAGGIELEFRLTQMSSALLGYRRYTHVGSGRLAGSASGEVSALFAGLHFEF
jgi:hypothetical protein